MCDVFLLVSLGLEVFRKNIIEVKCSSHSIVRVQVINMTFPDNGHLDHAAKIMFARFPHCKFNFLFSYSFL